MSTKSEIVASIEAAQVELEQALAKLGTLPPLDLGTVRTRAHTLGNYLNITSAGVQLLQMVLMDHPGSRDVAHAPAAKVAKPVSCNRQGQIISHKSRVWFYLAKESVFCLDNVVHLSSMLAGLSPLSPHPHGPAIPHPDSPDAAFHLWAGVRGPCGVYGAYAARIDRLGGVADYDPIHCGAAVPGVREEQVRGVR
jgi:hypothetical protein